MPTRFVVASALLGLACSPAAPPFAPVRDTGPPDAFVCPDCPDMGPVVIRPDAGRDTGPPSDANADAFRRDTGLTDTDAGVPLAITVDGEVTEARWAAESSEPGPGAAATAPFGFDRIDAFYFFRDETYLYLAFEGALESGNSVVVYVDLGSTVDDVNLMGGLSDVSGAVDATLSLPIYGTTDFAPELGWGTAMMPHSRSSGGSTIGWRRLAASGSFSVITTGSRSQCTSDACETAIPLASIGASPGSPLSFVARLGRPDVLAFSNQTIPDGDASSPEFIELGVVVPPAPGF